MAGLLDFEKLAGDPMMQMGLGIMANNRGNGGNFMPAFANGVNSGMANVQNYNQLAQHKLMQDQQLAMHKMQMNMLEKQQAKKDAEESWMKSYGANNSFSGINQPVAQTGDSPNFKTEFNPNGGTPKFDEGKWLTSGINAGAVSPFELIKLQRGEHDYDFKDGVMYDKKSGSSVKIGDNKQNDTPDIKNYEYAVRNGYKGSLTDYIQIKPQIMAAPAWANVGIAQQNSDNTAENTAYNTGRGRKAATTTAPFSVTVEGKTITFKDKKSLDNFKLSAGVK